MKDKKLLPYIFGLITGVILLPVTDELLKEEVPLALADGMN